MSSTIGVDIGGTKIAFGVVTPDGEVVARTRRETRPRGRTRSSARSPTASPSCGARHEVVRGGGRRGRVHRRGALDGDVRPQPRLARQPHQGAGRGRRSTSPSSSRTTRTPRRGASSSSARPAPSTTCSCSPSAPASVAAWSSTAGWCAAPTGSLRSSATPAPSPTGTAAAAATGAAGSSTSRARALTREARELAEAGLPAGHGHARPRRRQGEADHRAAGDRGRPDGDPTPWSCWPTSAVSWARRSPPSWRCSTRGSSSSGGGVSDAGDLLVGPARESYAHELTGRGFRPSRGHRPRRARQRGRSRRRRATWRGSQ